MVSIIRTFKDFFRKKPKKLKTSERMALSIAVNGRLEGFDFIRALAILIVFLAHILTGQSQNELLLFVSRILSPGLTMSLLGFISGYLLSVKNKLRYDGMFFVKRFVRIYSSIFICLSFIAGLHVYLGKDVVNQHSILHFMGLTAFFDVLQVENQSTIGEGLWFITIIVAMYLLLPSLSFILSHKNGWMHLILVVLSCLFLSFHISSGGTSIFNVVIAFTIGTYFGVHGKLESILKNRTSFFLLATLGVFCVCGFAIQGIIPNGMKDVLLPLYPITVVPLLLKFSVLIPSYMSRVIGTFSGISFEIYILHFYFIRENFFELFPGIQGVSLQILIAFIITGTLAFFFAKLASLVSRYLLKYFAH